VVDDIPGLRRLLATRKVIAVVGLSADWFRPQIFRGQVQALNERRTL